MNGCEIFFLRGENPYQPARASGGRRGDGRAVARGGRRALDRAPHMTAPAQPAAATPAVIAVGLDTGGLSVTVQGMSVSAGTH